MTSDSSSLFDFLLKKACLVGRALTRLCWPYSVSCLLLCCIHFRAILTYICTANRVLGCRAGHYLEVTIVELGCSWLFAWILSRFTWWELCDRCHRPLPVVFHVRCNVCFHAVPRHFVRNGRLLRLWKDLTGSFWPSIRKLGQFWTQEGLLVGIIDDYICEVSYVHFGPFLGRDRLDFIRNFHYSTAIIFWLKSRWWSLILFLVALKLTDMLDIFWVWELFIDPRIERHNQSFLFPWCCLNIFGVRPSDHTDTKICRVREAIAESLRAHFVQTLHSYHVSDWRPWPLI